MLISTEPEPEPSPNIINKRISPQTRTSLRKQKLSQKMPHKAPKRKTIPKGRSILDIKDLTRDDLAEQLRDANIDFDNKALKPRLQATFAMMKLGIMTQNGPLDELLLVSVTKWCGMSANNLASELSDRNLSDEANKWKRVEALIRNE